MPINADDGDELPCVSTLADDSPYKGGERHLQKAVHVPLSSLLACDPTMAESAAKDHDQEWSRSAAMNCTV